MKRHLVTDSHHTRHLVNNTEHYSEKLTFFLVKRLHCRLYKKALLMRGSARDSCATW